MLQSEQLKKCLNIYGARVMSRWVVDDVYLAGCLLEKKHGFEMNSSITH